MGIIQLNMTTLFTSLGTLSTYIANTPFTFFTSSLQGSILSGYMQNLIGPEEFTYTADLAMLIMVWTAAAYVVVKTVNANISFTRGFYAVYSGASTMGDLVGLFE